MVAHQEDEPAATGEVAQLLDGSLRVRTVVDHVAQDDDRVVFSGIDGVDQAPQGRAATMNIANREQSVGRLLRYHSRLLKKQRPDNELKTSGKPRLRQSSVLKPFSRGLRISNACGQALDANSRSIGLLALCRLVVLKRVFVPFTP
jgi:hypothetical protein